jgi:hypothetical protein
MSGGWGGAQVRTLRPCRAALLAAAALLRRWGRHVVVYGEEGLKRDHPVIAFL